jgi:ABC-type branched-subunit amino acid transport system substrate-binding protein
MLLFFFLASQGIAEPLKVGMILPLTGPVAPMGEAFRKGVELYIEEQPGVKEFLALRYEDSRYDGKMTLGALQKLSSVDGVDVSVVWGNTPSGVAAPVAESKKLPLIALSMNPDARGRRYVVTFGPPTEHLVANIAQQFAAWKESAPAAVSIDLGNALMGIEMLRKLLKGNLKVMTVANEEKDFRPLILRLRNEKVSSLLLFLLPEQALTFARQTLELGYTPKVIGGDIFASETFQRSFASALPELCFSYGAVSDEFRARLQKRFGDSSYFFEAASGYAVVAILHRLMLESPATGQALFQGFSRVPLTGLPTEGLRLVQDSEYGTHFEAGAKIYKVSGRAF